MKVRKASGLLGPIPWIAMLLLLLFAYACDTNYFSVSTDVDVQDLPRDVVKAVDQHWPGARIKTAGRIYSSDSWGDYQLTFELAKGRTGYISLSKAGVIKWSYLD